MLFHMTKQRTLTVFKPDVIQRQIVGEILQRFERKGFKVVAMKMLVPSAELVGKHYSGDEAYLTDVGSKTIAFAKERGDNIPEGTPLELGQKIRQYNIDYLTCGPVIAMVLEGPNVIEAVRKIIGRSNPILADVGTIRSDYTTDSYFLADVQGRTTRTMFHASDSVEAANREIPLWFEVDEIVEYETAIEKILYDVGWSSN